MNVPDTSAGRPVNIIMHAGGWAKHDRYVRRQRRIWPPDPDMLREWRNPMPKFGLRVDTWANTNPLSEILAVWERIAAAGYTVVNAPYPIERREMGYNPPRSKP